jgi:hypothetical protein
LLAIFINVQTLFLRTDNKILINREELASVLEWDRLPALETIILPHIFSNFVGDDFCRFFLVDKQAHVLFILNICDLPNP